MSRLRCQASLGENKRFSWAKKHISVVFFRFKVLPRNRKLYCRFATGIFVTDFMLIDYPCVLRAQPGPVKQLKDRTWIGIGIIYGTRLNSQGSVIWRLLRDPFNQGKNEPDYGTSSMMSLSRFILKASVLAVCAPSALVTRPSFYSYRPLWSNTCNTHTLRAVCGIHLSLTATPGQCDWIGIRSSVSSPTCD